MSWEALTWVRHQTVGHAHSKHVLVIMANYADERGSCFPSVEHLAGVCEVSERTVGECIKRLEADGYLTRVRDRRADGTLGLTRYQLCLERPPRPSQPPEAASGGDQPQTAQEPAEADASARGSCFRSDTPENPSGESSERENARACDLEPERDEYGLTEEERKALYRELWQLAKDYPGSIADPLEKSEPVWYRLAPDERERARKRLPAFVAELKAGKSKRRPPLHEYLGERKFDLVETPAEKAATGPQAFRHFGFADQGWWAILWRLLKAGALREFQFKATGYLAAKGIQVTAADVPSEAELEALTKIPIPSPQFDAWSAHVDEVFRVQRRTSCRLPQPDKVPFAWVPSEWPPDHGAAEAQSEIDEVLR